MAEGMKAVCHTIQSVFEQIELLKEKLYVSYKSVESFSDPAIVKVSQELDELITVYQQISMQYK